MDVVPTSVTFTVEPPPTPPEEEEEDTSGDPSSLRNVSLAAPYASTSNGSSGTRASNSVVGVGLAPALTEEEEEDEEEEERETGP